MTTQQPCSASLSAPSSGGRLTATQGTALYVGAVLGTGVIALPALAAQTAGPASLLAWLALVALSAVLAATFAALGARHPDSGGVSTYARLAFGRQAAAVVGWCFYFAIPLGAAAAALFAGAYVESALGGGSTTVTLTAAGIMTAATVTNAAGLRLTGGVQLALSALLVTLLLTTVALSAPDVDTGRLTPFAPHGWGAVGSAATLLVWSFAGWEAITHLAGEFRRPERDLPRATAAAVAVVGVLYLAVAFCVVAVLGEDAARSEAPLGELMARGLGGDARLLAAAVAVALTLGVFNAYYSGAAKLGAALGRDGALPAWLARGSLAGQVPRRSLTLVAALSFLALAAVTLTRTGTEPLVLMTNGCFTAVYALGVAAALRLLPPRSAGRRAAACALAAVVGLLVLSGVYLVWPVALAAGALVYVRRRQDRGAAPPASTR